MSIGTVIADADTFAPVEMKYHILPMECKNRWHVLRLPVPGHAGEAHPLLSFRGHKRPSHLIPSAWRSAQLRLVRHYALGRLPPAQPQDPHKHRLLLNGRFKHGYGVEPMLLLLSRDPCISRDT